MADWKDTLNLPRTDFPMKANLPTAEPEALAKWDGDGPVRADSCTPAGRAEVRPARRPALRQRPHPSRHGAEQDPEGLGRQVASMAGFDAPYVPG